MVINIIVLWVVFFIIEYERSSRYPTPSILVHVGYFGVCRVGLRMPNELGYQSHIFQFSFLEE